MEPSTRLSFMGSFSSEPTSRADARFPSEPPLEEKKEDAVISVIARDHLRAHDEGLKEEIKENFDSSFYLTKGLSILKTILGILLFIT